MTGGMQKIGEITTDTGCFVLSAPENIFSDDRPGRSKIDQISYETFIEKLDAAEDNLKRGDSGNFIKPFEKSDTAIITSFGGDGTFDVYGNFEYGRLVGIYVEFSTAADDLEEMTEDEELDEDDLEDFEDEDAD